jgi:hypothetical protein
MFYFLNYQAVPFSLAFGIFFLLLMLETQQKSTAIIVTQLALYCSLLITHVFVALFFIIYLLIRSVLDRSNLYGRMLLFSLVSYLAVQLTLSQFSFGQIIKSILTLPYEYSGIVSATLRLITVPIDVTAQLFSRTVTIAFVLLCVAGFVFLLIKKRMRVLDKAVLLTGASYTLLGFVINTLGWRALAVAFIPISLGAAYFFESRFRKYLTGIFLVLLVLFLFIPLHQSFTSEVEFQTKSAYVAENFFIEYYNWEKPTHIITSFRVETYLQPKLNSYTYIYTGPETFNQSDAIVHTVELDKDFLDYNTTLENVIQEQKMNIVYDNGLSSVEIKAAR